MSAPNCFRHHYRTGFTLVELLITMGIIGILASLVLFAMVTAQTAAREAKTKTMIATIEQLLMERYESYRTRRVPIVTTGTREQMSVDRLNGIRRLMQLEMPERWTEVTMLVADATPLTQLPGLNAIYQSRYQAAVDAGKPPNDIRRNQGAETLYLVVTLACGDGEALEHFKAGDVADTDQDGLKEFIDGWGHPISWLRWPAGFASERQTRIPETDPDPFDAFGMDAGAYRLVPLVYSGGRDNVKGIQVELDSTTLFYSYPTKSKLDRNAVSHQILDPYDAGISASQIGAITDAAAATDNIHNHLLETR